MSKKRKKKIISEEIRLQKKEAVMRKSKARKLPGVFLLGGIVLAAAGIFLYQTASNSGDTASLSAAENHKPEAVSYDLALFADGRARHFEFQNDRGKTIRYFIVKSSDGVIRAAFDACDVCWPAGKGYAQDGDQMICRNCGRRFDSVRINEVKGGCNPAPLARKVEGDQLIIHKSHILEGLQYFDFTKGVT